MSNNGVDYGEWYSWPSLLEGRPEHEDTMAEMKFEEWKKEVNRAIEKVCGLSADDLPDIPYYDLFHAGDTPEQAARHAILYAQDLDPDDYDDEETIWVSDVE